MRKKLNEIAEEMKRKFGLQNYTLERMHLHREIGTDRRTHYTYNMEWFPKGYGPEEEGVNPEGAVSIDVDLHTHELKTLIFVGGKSYADSIKLEKEDEVIRWVEAETNLIFGEHFHSVNREDGHYHFVAAVDGIRIVPYGSIEVRLDEDGKLVFFSIYGHFPNKDKVEKEPYSLTLDNIREIVMEQLLLIKFPVNKEKRMVYAYAIEEIYVTNDGRKLRPFLLSEALNHVQVDETITFDKPLDEPFHEQKVELTDEVSLDQAIHQEPHPDLASITKALIEKANNAIERFMRMKYPADSGAWTWKSIGYQNGYLVASLEEKDYADDFLQKKLKLFLDSEGEQVLNDMDNHFLHELVEDFEGAPETKVTKQEAFESLEDEFSLTPAYVYDEETGKYQLCGMLDCTYAVEGHTGQVVPLDSL